MKMLSLRDASVNRDNTELLPVRVCVHALRSARSDYRGLRTAVTLVKAGFEVSIIDVESEPTFPAEEVIDGICLIHIIIPSWFTSRSFQPWFFFTSVHTFMLSVYQLMRSQADIYHAIDLMALPASYIAAKLRRKPIIFETYELYWPMPETDVAFWRPLGRLLIRLLTVILPHCAGMITISPPIAQKLCQLHNLPKVSVVRNVPEYQVAPKTNRLRQYLGLGSEVRIALYQGEFHPNRGLDRLIRAACFLEPNVMIVLMGKGMGTTQVELEALIADEGVTEHVRIIPPAPYHELLEWTTSADIGLLVYPLDFSLNVRWCLPNKFFEYMMVGLPVLASELDAVVEVIKTYGVGQIVSSLDPADIGAAINTMLADRNALRCMKQNALEAVRKEFCWEKEKQKLVDIYYNILKRNF